MLPNAPSVTATPDENSTNICRFSWSVATSTTDAKMFTNIEYQTMLVASCNETNGSRDDERHENVTDYSSNIVFPSLISVRYSSHSFCSFNFVLTGSDKSCSI